MTRPDDPIQVGNYYKKLTDGRVDYSDGDYSPGLSKREHFAAMAMQGFISTGQYKSSSTIAEDAVYLADALITELNKTDQSK